MVLSLSMSAPTDEHLSPCNAHTVSHVCRRATGYHCGAAPRYHCGAAIAVTDGEAPLERVDVGVVLRVQDAVRVAVAVQLGKADQLANDNVAVAVLEALAPAVRLLVGVYDGSGQ